MGTDTTARQNVVIWSATGSLVLVLLTIIGWLVTGKDNQILTSIKEVRENQTIAISKAEESDKRILEILNSLCERVGRTEGDIRSLQMEIRLPFPDRIELYKRFGVMEQKNRK
jgi:RecA-family ATPase